jgi:predicted alpha/beta superfamily hydrolase
LLSLARAETQPAAADDLVFGDGVEGYATAHIYLHYPASAHFLSARGNGGGLAAGQGRTFARTGDTFTLALEVAAPVDWKPLLDDLTYAIGPDYAIAPGDTVEIWPHFSTTQGQVITLFPAFASTILGNSRAIYAYVPPTYLENDYAVFPVVYVQDGQNLWASHPEYSQFGVTWAVDTAFDAAAADGSIREAIVIGVASTNDRIYEYTPTYDPDFMAGGGADSYAQMLVDELKPAVDAALRTRADATSTVLAGSSFGGLLAAHVGRYRPDVFGSIAALSPSAWWDGNVIVSEVMTTPPAPDRLLRVYVDSGESVADNETDTTALAAAYVTAGYVDGMDLLHVVQAGGQHNETYWAQRFPGAMQFVLGPRD